MSPVDTAERLRAICAAVGFDFGSVKPSLVGRLELLAEHSEIVADGERMVARAWDVFRYYEREKPAEAFTDLERRVVVLGCVFSDVGKTGPVDADATGQALIAEMFAVEGVRDETQSVERFFAAYFPVDSTERVRRFSALGLDPKLTMREFWNLHSSWTLDILQTGGVPPEAIAAAATHHLLDNVNPGAIVAPDGRYSRPFGDNVSFDRAEKLVILLDKYDALRRRGGLTHDPAISWLRKRVDENRAFRGDAELVTLISDLDAVCALE